MGKKPHGHQLEADGQLETVWECFNKPEVRSSTCQPKLHLEAAIDDS